MQTRFENAAFDWLWCNAEQNVWDMIFIHIWHTLLTMSILGVGQRLASLYRNMPKLSHKMQTAVCRQLS